MYIYQIYVPLSLACVQSRSAEFHYAQVFTLWSPGLLLTELATFLCSPLQALILYHWLRAWTVVKIRSQKKIKFLKTALIDHRIIEKKLGLLLGAIPIKIWKLIFFTFFPIFCSLEKFSFSCKAPISRIASQIRKMLKHVRKMYDNFRFSEQILAKIIIHFSSFTVFQFM